MISHLSSRPLVAHMSHLLILTFPPIGRSGSVVCSIPKDIQWVKLFAISPQAMFSKTSWSLVFRSN